MCQVKSNLGTVSELEMFQVQPSCLQPTGSQTLAANGITWRDCEATNFWTTSSGSDSGGLGGHLRICIFNLGMLVQVTLGDHHPRLRLQSVVCTVTCVNFIKYNQSLREAKIPIGSPVQPNLEPSRSAIQGCFSSLCLGMTEQAEVLSLYCNFFGQGELYLYQILYRSF